jgi:hypothetical protein
MARLERQASASSDPELNALLDEMRGYVGKLPPIHYPDAVAVTLKVESSSWDELTILHMCASHPEPNRIHLLPAVLPSR